MKVLRADYDVYVIQVGRIKKATQSNIPAVG
jgi:hypothetical protein